MALSRWLHSSLIFSWHDASFPRCRWIGSLKFFCIACEVTTSYDLTESIANAVEVSLSRGGNDAVIEYKPAWWPWAAFALSTKQYVHTYHQTRHKSPSPQVDSKSSACQWVGWEGCAEPAGSRKEHPVQHVIADVKKTTRLENVSALYFGFLPGGAGPAKFGTSAQGPMWASSYSSCKMAEVQHRCIPFLVCHWPFNFRKNVHN